MRNRNFLIVLGIAIAGFVIWYFQHIVIYLVIAGVLTLIGQPIDRFLLRVRIAKFRLSPTVAALLAFLSLFLGFSILAIFFVPLVMEEARILSSLDRATVMASLQEPLEATEKFLRTFNIDLEVMNLPVYVQEKMMSFLTLTNLSLFFNQVVSTLGDFFVAFFAVSFFTFFFLRDEEMIKNALFSMMPERHSRRAKKVWNDSENMLKRYFIGILIEILLIITFLSIGLWIAGIKHALLIALFAGVASVIPYVGPLIGIGFALFIGLTTSTEISLAAAAIRILIVHSITYVVDGFFLQPLIYSSSVKAHPLEIFLVILAGATIGGVGGMIAAVPAYTVIRVIAREFLTHFDVGQQEEIKKPGE